MERHVFFGLGVETGIDNETIDEDPNVVSDLMRLDVDPSFVLFLHKLHNVVLHHFGDIVNVAASFRGGNTVDEGHLLKSIVREGHGYFPPLSRRLVHGLDLTVVLVLVAFEEKIDILLKR